MKRYFYTNQSTLQIAAAATECFAQYVQILDNASLNSVFELGEGEMPKIKSWTIHMEINAQSLADFSTIAQAVIVQSEGTFSNNVYANQTTLSALLNLAIDEAFAFRTIGKGKTDRMTGIDATFGYIRTIRWSFELPRDIITMMVNNLKDDSSSENYYIAFIGRSDYGASAININHSYSTEINYSVVRATLQKDIR